MSEPMVDISHVYADPENCKKDILLARKTFGNRNTTMRQYDLMQRALGMMCLYCPKSLLVIVHATMNEAMSRRIYFEFGPWLSLNCKGA